MKKNGLSVIAKFKKSDGEYKLILNVVWFTNFLMASTIILFKERDTRCKKADAIMVNHGRIRLRIPVLQ